MSDARTPTYYVRPDQLHRKGGNCDCSTPCVEVVKVEDRDALVAALDGIANYRPPQSDGGCNAAVWASDMRAIARDALKAARGES